eukprot:8035137-Pyramimonas_sp.AAC.1
MYLGYPTRDGRVLEVDEVGLHGAITATNFVKSGAWVFGQDDETPSLRNEVPEEHDNHVYLLLPGSKERLQLLLELLVCAVE